MPRPRTAASAMELEQEEAGGRVGVLHVAAAGAGVALGGGAEQAARGARR